MAEKVWRFIFTLSVVTSVLLGIANGIGEDYAEGAHYFSFAAVLLLIGGRERLGP